MLSSPPSGVECRAAKRPQLQPLETHQSLPIPPPSQDPCGPSPQPVALEAVSLSLSWWPWSTPLPSSAQLPPTIPLLSGTRTLGVGRAGNPIRSSKTPPVPPWGQTLPHQTSPPSASQSSLGYPALPGQTSRLLVCVCWGEFWCPTPLLPWGPAGFHHPLLCLGGLSWPPCGHVTVGSARSFMLSRAAFPRPME